MVSVISSFQERIRQAAASKRTLRIQGGNTKHFYGEHKTGHDLLDVREHTGVVSYEPSELVVTVRGGTPLAELEQLLSTRGQCLAYEPPHFGSAATVGGMVAAGLAGPSRASTGALRDHVLGARMINGLAEELTFGGQVMKNVAGYDVSRVLAGSMGTLGIVTEVSLKVLPTAPTEATLLCHLPQHQALNQLHRWGAQALPLNASCWWHDVKYAPAADVLSVRLRGAVAAVESACPRMIAEVQASGGSAARLDPQQALPVWQAIREQTLSFFQPMSADHALWRLSLPQTAPVLNLPYPVLIEWHGGLRWLWAPLSVAQQLRQAAQQAGGHATLFRGHCAGEVPVFSELPVVQQRIQRELQQQFDPHGVFNTVRLGV
ncbi:MAG: glycolate oxidase subunit GlcE [Limnohabitans sp.]|nr:glycolate oxidase subunit GlcE [Limnohabitans sp.]